MSDLEPCPACQRHVRLDEATCPFCAAALAGGDARTLSTRRLTRAAVFAGAALATAAAGCGGKQPTQTHDNVVENEVADGGADVAPTPDAAAIQNVEVDHSCCMPYGAPPVRERLV